MVGMLMVNSIFANTMELCH